MEQAVWECDPLHVSLLIGRRFGHLACKSLQSSCLDRHLEDANFPKDPHYSRVSPV